MEIIKEKVERENCCNFYFKDEDQTLKIMFCGNLDLYWYLYKFSDNDKNLSMEEIRKMNSHEQKHTFIITKENYFIYSLFEELYNDIKESRIFIPSQPHDQENDDEIIKTYTEEEINKINQKNKNLPPYKKLFNGEIIEWHSDDDQYERADRVKIIKQDEIFILEFIRPALADYNCMYHIPNSVNIRFRNSGSQYDPYNVIFMRMFQKIQDYDPEYHQIHFEEINYQRKRLKK